MNKSPSGKLGAVQLWWNLPQPRPRVLKLEDIVEEQPSGVRWHQPHETEKLLAMMSEFNLRKVEKALEAGQRVVGTVYRRTRPDENGVKRQRAEVRFDGVAGCLRTPSGGSSRQTIVVVENGTVRSRLLSPREAARLMGLPESYLLPERYNDAYHLAGDGVCVDVVQFLSQNLLVPLTADAVDEMCIAAE
ncbi:MAG: DNA cytosine methyltransferase [Rhodobacterales bacterium]